MAKNCIGLDIGSSAIKVVQVKVGKNGVQLQAFDVERLPPQTIVDGTIMNQSAVVDAIQELWGRMRLRGKDVAVAISGSSVIIKKIQLPPMDNEELEEQIPWEAEQHIPFAKDDVEIDFQVLTPQNASGQMELLLVAGKKEVVHDYAAVVREAGLTPRIVDVAAFGVQNSFEHNYSTATGETVVLVNAGASLSNINILKAGANLFTRDINVGGNHFTEEIQKQLNVSYEEAEAYKIGGAHGEQGVVPQEVEGIMETVGEMLAGELQRSLDFFLATSAEANVSRIYLAGGTAKAGPLPRALEKKARLPVEVLDAWKEVKFDSSVDPTLARLHSPDALVGLGLAMRIPGDNRS